MIRRMYVGKRMLVVGKDDYCNIEKISKMYKQKQEGKFRQALESSGTGGRTEDDVNVISNRYDHPDSENIICKEVEGPIGGDAYFPLAKNKDEDASVDSNIKDCVDEVNSTICYEKTDVGNDDLAFRGAFLSSAPNSMLKEHIARHAIALNKFTLERVFYVNSICPRTSQPGENSLSIDMSIFFSFFRGGLKRMVESPKYSVCCAKSVENPKLLSCKTHGIFGNTVLFTSTCDKQAVHPCIFKKIRRESEPGCKELTGNAMKRLRLDLDVRIVEMRASSSVVSSDAQWRDSIQEDDGLESISSDISSSDFADEYIAGILSTLENSHSIANPGKQRSKHPKILSSRRERRL